MPKGRRYPRITRKLEIKDYHPDMAGDYLDIWLNWTGDFNQRMTDWQNEYNDARQIEDKTARDQRLNELNEQIDELNAEFWGCTPEQVRRICHAGRGRLTFMCRRCGPGGFSYDH